MFNPIEADFQKIKAWGHTADPLKAIDDFKPEYLSLREKNPYHVEANKIYTQKRLDYINKKNFDHYYKTASKPIDRKRWEYLKDRKAWFIAPLNWDCFSTVGVSRILDLGCGDGDVTQRVADFIAEAWKLSGYAGHQLEIYGYDLNPSRIENAKLHCSSPHPLITFKFGVVDVVGKGMNEPDKFFDYSLSTGVLEILEDEPANRFMDELTRVTNSGIYIEDLADVYPGGYPREDFAKIFDDCGFELIEDHYVLTEPFVVEGSLDPMELWPVQKDRLMFAVRKK